ncbi:MAG: YggT family protein [Treponema sp.]|nr:YggT family protein [Treponema sp.]
MEGTVQLVFQILASFLSIYSLLVVVRILLSWFPGTRHSMPVLILSRITDPYLDWWRRRLNLRIGFLDLSPLVAMAALSAANWICTSFARFGKVGPGTILAICLSAVWSIASFVLGFFIIVLILRLIAFITSRNIYSPFWQVIDTISRPLLFRINRIIFGRKIVSYMTGIVVTIAVIGIILLLGSYMVNRLFIMLSGLPL